ncbi:MAG TPA: SusD/RagB family nutrient-binding outer membrane lipoprotein [Hymenobacter sp.]|uniref:SusD/RagB family nutrient-binding outer membrane lipoprotein n=1 Tax=Hymenobacter sp. TaxID=1898978 RepID=UPI002D7ED891|nr:SusD/RagB family nutrient-binding outer membrane lipoprotein [Hymenobacter sp.]HET9502322.1 SusD/RagB family nutrient-binding outer membrane lipoprotein [Hymenobacter sp.]
MKQFAKLIASGVLLASVSSCSSFLDVNNNPNSPLSATPNTILAQALSVTASNYTGGGTNYNSYGSWTAGYWAKSGTVNGYGTERTYTYTSNFYQGLWGNTYNNLEDYQIIQNGAAGYGRHAAIARIMKVYNFLLLVDEYGDIPYFNALKGLDASLTPKYDSAPAIYRDFLTQLDGAIADINKAVADPAQIAVSSEDIVFQGNMTNWKRFANTLKLRILMRASQSNNPTELPLSLVQSELAKLGSATTTPDGFITADVVAQPGYLQTSGKQNPFFDRYGVVPAGNSFTAEYSYQLPTSFILEQYVNNRDPRVAQLYANAPTLQSDGVTPRPASDWDYSYNYFGTTITGNLRPYIGADLGYSNPWAGNRASRFRNGGGLLKGFNMPTPLMLMSEYYFLRAEAETRGLLTGGDAAAKTDFLSGIQASFTYFYRPATAAATSVTSGVTEYNTYISNNSTNPLVNYDLATSNGTLGKQAVIMYQKYLAMNTVGSIEAWDDYRRTGLPKFRVSTETSLTSRPDKLPTRLLYPQSEVSTNAANIPAVTNTSKIFWDVVDSTNP